MSPEDSSANEFVARSALFANVPPETIARALASIELVEFAPGEPVIVESSSKASDEDSCLYVLVEGQLLASRSVGGGRVERLSTMGPGEFFGELARADEGTRSATVTAVTPAVVARLPGPATDRLIAEAPAVMRTIAGSIARRLRAADEARLVARLNEERFSSVGKAAAMLVHDLRNPLGIVMNSLFLIEQGVGDPLNWAHKSKSAAEFMQAMVQDLLDFAKGDRIFARARLTLGEVVGDVESFGLEPLEAAGTIEVKRSLCGDAALFGDRRAISRALLNIVKNAADAMSPGGTLSFVTELHADKVHIIVVDTGPGIPDHVLANLFEPFATYGKAGGTGLGMAMTKATIEGHDGRINVSTRMGEGTTFTVVLPVTT